ncbi:MAG: sugar transferase [Oscillospiraceae bacterium]
MGRYKKQYNIQQVAWLDQPDLLTCVDHADAVFLYELSVRERTDLVEYCYQTRKDLYYSLEMSDVVAMAGERVMFDDKTMMYCPVRELRFEERIVKRLGDILVSVVGLVLTSPILLATALAIRLEDGGPVFYRQKRATYGGRVFEVYKFRSMRAQDGSIHVSAKKDDDRITKVGHIIRKFRIDELPQLINVLKSDMSIVGPRPEMLENVEKYTDDLPEFRYRLRAKAGLTGLAQIYGKYNTSPRDKLIMDLAYIQQYSVWLDLKLILRTALVLLTPEESTEAFEDKKTEEKP